MAHLDTGNCNSDHMGKGVFVLDNLGTLGKARKDSHSDVVWGALGKASVGDTFSCGSSDDACGNIDGPRRVACRLLYVQHLLVAQWPVVHIV